ncbi:MAG TPA: FAD-dependent monooxygenase [Candidatus Binatia bacterium]|nr:FAD-dependent monooxygenase [Candidatus Binatia bacterium]
MVSVCETPVLIVGGGPVGLALAADLGWRGIACVLVEQTDGRINTPKMNEVNVRTMEFCRRWGIADKVVNCPFPDDHPMDAVFVTSLGGYELARMERPAKRYQTAGSLSPMIQQICSQTWFDPILCELAQSYSDVTLRHRCRLETFESHEGGVTAEIVDLKTGERERMKARFLAACDGANSGIRRALGIKLVGSEVLSRPFHMFFRIPDLFSKLGIRPGTFYLAIDRNGLWANIRVIDPVEGLWRLMVLDSPADLDPNQIDRDAYLHRALGRDIDVEWVGVSVWTRRGVVAERYSQGPVCLLGDAVHQLSPTGALGMNTGIADAVDLSWKLAAVIEGWGGDGLLASYDAERRPIGERNVRAATGYYQGHLDFERGVEAIEEATAEGDQFRKRLGEKLSRDIGRMFRTIGVQLGYRYDSSPICVPDGTPPPADEPETYVPTARPGARAPHVWLDDGRSALDLFGRVFVLLRLGSKAPDPSALARAAARCKMPLQVVTLHEPDVLQLYGRRLILVRPDGHVAWRGDEIPADVETLVDRVRGTSVEIAKSDQ